MCVSMTKLTDSLTNTDEGGLLFGALTRSAVGCTSRSPRRTLSKSESSDVSRSFSTMSNVVELFLPRLSVDFTDARLSSLFSFSSSFGAMIFGTLVGGLGLGGGVDFPNECLLGEERDAPELRAAVAVAEAATGGVVRVAEIKTKIGF